MVSNFSLSSVLVSRALTTIASITPRLLLFYGISFKVVYVTTEVMLFSYSGYDDVSLVFVTDLILLMPITLSLLT